MTVIDLSHRTKEEAIREAVKRLKGGGVIAFPTETFYGVGVRYDDRAALAKLCALKGRPAGKAMPLVLGDRNDLYLLTTLITPLAEILIRKFWPGPLTLLFKSRPDLPDLLTAGTGKVAARIPGKSFALDLVRAGRFPVTATSANLSGFPPAESAADVTGYFGESLDLVIDGGRAPGGKPSTIVDVSGESIEIVREGAAPPEEIRACLEAGREISGSKDHRNRKDRLQP